MTTELTPEILLNAYAAGVFPMAESRDNPEIFWVDPQHRGIFPLDGFHISRSLARSLRKGSYQIHVNRDFAACVSACADREETWINDEIFSLYNALNEHGFAHSLEVWDQDALVGGVYGVTLGGAFFGESMFSRQRDASKIALAYLVDRLRRCGYVLFDTQFLTPHLASLGAIEIPRATYRAQLADALRVDANFYSDSSVPSGASIVQRNTQTS
ncbi:leucyl/phenylalanyl-tRNA--protein transferase [Halocynthiibacter sp. C4]|uniref:leucyl/phenylalanyl-tRNA--protein transferase n=1 Tax=Halocynthiibacter sp. C4 TaxID=2992758 RepID=UPI00237A23AD|nr:leucyl/phenylalanyl-tRNA--protein transferase [Halocynthiibacter sp. C4]MDE0590060.1 leucyl/phenylalanyl-tRNA--protein transferase [Halocynthiibacter sp. C4]